MFKVYTYYMNIHANGVFILCAFIPMWLREYIRVANLVIYVFNTTTLGYF